MLLSLRWASRLAWASRAAVSESAISAAFAVLIWPLSAFSAACWAATAAASCVCVMRAAAISAAVPGRIKVFTCAACAAMAAATPCMMAMPRTASCGVCGAASRVAAGWAESRCMTGRSFSKRRFRMLQLGRGGCLGGLQAGKALRVCAGLVLQLAKRGGGFHLLLGQEGGLRLIRPRAQAGGLGGMLVQRQFLLRIVACICPGQSRAAGPGAEQGPGTASSDQRFSGHERGLGDTEQRQQRGCKVGQDAVMQLRAGRCRPRRAPAPG